MAAPKVGDFVLLKRFAIDVYKERQVATVNFQLTSDTNLHIRRRVFTLDTPGPAIWENMERDLANWQEISCLPMSMDAPVIIPGVA